MADKTNANIGFEKQLWDAACVLSLVVKVVVSKFDKNNGYCVDSGRGLAA